PLLPRSGGSASSADRARGALGPSGPSRAPGVPRGIGGVKSGYCPCVFDLLLRVRRRQRPAPSAISAAVAPPTSAPPRRSGELVAAPGTRHPPRYPMPAGWLPSPDADPGARHCPSEHSCPFGHTAPSSTPGGVPPSVGSPASLSAPLQSLSK